MASRHDTTGADGPLNRSQSSQGSSRRPSDPRKALNPKMLAGMQSQAANKNKSKDTFVKELEQEFKHRHLGLLGVFAWVL